VEAAVGNAYGSVRLAPREAELEAEAQTQAAAAAAKAEAKAQRLAEQKRLRDARPADWWAPKFLALYALSGNKSKAAKAAGADAKTVRALEASSSEFAEQVEEARLEFIDNLEEELVRLSKEKSQPIAAIARLKAELPHKYEDKLRVDGAMKHLHAVAPLSPEAATELLRTMLLEATDVSIAQLTSVTPAAVAPTSVAALPPAASDAANVILGEVVEDAAIEAGA
jgi:chorismate mutase